MIPWDILKSLVSKLEDGAGHKQVCVGFDGYVDSLYRVVKNRRTIQDFDTYSTITEFAGRLASAAGLSADMELQSISRRMGGNAPLMAEAMGCLGIPTRCIGAMGYPDLEDVFSEDRVHFTPTTLTQSATCMALEFNDGKLMFGNTEPLQKLTWDRIVQRIGLDTINAWYRECDAWAVVNWSFVLNCNDILKGFFTDVIRKCEEDRSRILFFDLADPSGRSEEEILCLLALLQEMNEKCRIVLSMNENEAKQVAAALELPESKDVSEACTAIREKTGIWLTSIHGLTYAVAATAESTVCAETIYHPSPVISTGGGDHFNGGFCTALIHGMEPFDALSFGNLVSSCYVGLGHSPSLLDLLTYIDEYSKQ